MSAAATIAPAQADSAKSFLLQRAQPAMTGLIDGSLSTLAPIFAVALATHRPQYAFFAGLATAKGSTFCKQFGSSGAMNRAINSTAAEKCRVSRVYNGVHI